MVSFTEDLKQVLGQASQDIAADAPHNWSAKQVAECALEHVGLHSEIEGMEVSALVEVHGYKKVLAEAKKHVSTW
jgi:hypothetical protein